MSRCRCGHDLSLPGPHPCHGKSHACKKPGKRRLYNARPAILAGYQVKYTVDETFACDACWDEFAKLLPGQP